MEQKKQPVEQFYYSKEEWNRLGCGPLPAERDRAGMQTDLVQTDTQNSTKTKT